MRRYLRLMPLDECVSCQNPAMCARYAFFSATLFQQEFDVVPEDLEPHYNIAPTDVAPVVVATETGRRFDQMQWGLVPSWSKDPSIGQKLINARAETLREKPSFRSAFQRRRCLVPADGFFEWKGEKGKKQPYFFHLKSRLPFALAGLWEHWEGLKGALDTFTIVTTEPNELLATVHTRMPVIIARSDYKAWLDHGSKDTGALLPLLAPFPADAMEMYAVSKAMSNPAFESPMIVEPIASESLF